MSITAKCIGVHTNINCASLMEAGDKNTKIISDIGHVFPNFWLMKISGTYSWINAKKKKKMLKTCFGSLPVSDEADEVDRGISVVEIHGASLWCEGPSNEMRSRGFTGVWWGGLACFHFRLTDFRFFFPQCSRITNCFVTRMWSVLCFLFAVRFLEQVVLKCVF